MEITIKQGTFKLVNPQKVERVVVGDTNAMGKMVKGVGKEAEGIKILTGYDKLGGLITGKEGSKVKMGSFWDFENGVARKEPEIVYVFKVNGRVIELGADEKLPLEVQAAQVAEKESKKDKKK